MYAIQVGRVKGARCPARPPPQPRAQRTGKADWGTSAAEHGQQHAASARSRAATSLGPTPSSATRCATHTLLAPAPPAAGLAARLVLQLLLQLLLLRVRP